MIKIKVNKIYDLDDYKVILELNSEVIDNADYSIIVFNEKDKFNIFKNTDFLSDYTDFVESV